MNDKRWQKFENGERFLGIKYLTEKNVLDSIPESHQIQTEIAMILKKHNVKFIIVDDEHLTDGVKEKIANMQ